MWSLAIAPGLGQVGADVKHKKQAISIKPGGVRPRVSGHSRLLHESIDLTSISKGSRKV